MGGWAWGGRRREGRMVGGTVLSKKVRSLNTCANRIALLSKSFVYTVRSKNIRSLKMCTNRIALLAKSSVYTVLPKKTSLKMCASRIALLANSLDNGRDPAQFVENAHKLYSYRIGFKFAF